MAEATKTNKESLSVSVTKGALAVIAGLLLGGGSTYAISTTKASTPPPAPVPSTAEIREVARVEAAKVISESPITAAITRIEGTLDKLDATMRVVTADIAAMKADVTTLKDNARPVPVVGRR